jgi:hypothetical protein
MAQAAPVLKVVMRAAAVAAVALRTRVVQLAVLVVSAAKVKLEYIQSKERVQMLQKYTVQMKLFSQVKWSV